MNRRTLGGFLLIDDFSEAFYGWRTFQKTRLGLKAFRGFLKIEVRGILSF